MATNNTTTQVLIAKSNGIPPLIQLVSKGSPEAQESAARALWHLASSNESQVAIADSGGITPLVGMLSAEDARSQEIATVAISRLARGNPTVSITIADSGGIVPLVRLIKDGSATSQLQAAAALAEVGLVSANRDVIAKAGGIAPLVAMLSSARHQDRQRRRHERSRIWRVRMRHRAAARRRLPRRPLMRTRPRRHPLPKRLRRLPPRRLLPRVPAPSPASLATVGDVAVVAAQKVRDEVEGGPARRALIKAAGGVRKLIQLLDPNGPQDDGSPKDPKTGQQLWKQVQNVVAVVGEGLDSGGEVGQSKIIDVGVQTAAAAALSDLAKGDEDMQDAIIADGGVTPLLALVRAGSPEAQEHAARAIWALLLLSTIRTLLLRTAQSRSLVCSYVTGRPLLRRLARR